MEETGVVDDMGSVATDGENTEIMIAESANDVAEQTLRPAANDDNIKNSADKVNKEKSSSRRRHDSTSRSPSGGRNRERGRDKKDSSSRRRDRGRRDSSSPDRRRRHSRSRDRSTTRRRSSPTPPRRRRRHDSPSPDRRRRRSRSSDRRRRKHSSSSSRDGHRRRRSRRDSSTSADRRRRRRGGSRRRSHSSERDAAEKKTGDAHPTSTIAAAAPPPLPPAALPYGLSPTAAAVTAQQQQQLAMALAMGGNSAANPALAALLGMNMPVQPLGGLGTAGGFGGLGMYGGLPGTVSMVEPKELRELFVGNTPPGTNEQVLLEFLNLAMRHVKLATGPEGVEPVITCRMNNKFAFVECRTAEDANRMLNLNNIPFMGALLKIGRPSKYTGPHIQARTWQQMLGQPIGGYDAPAVISSTPAVASSDDRPLQLQQQQQQTFISVDPATKVYRELFVGNTSPEMTEQAILEFINGAMEKMGLSSGPGNPVISCRVSPRFAFIELRSIAEAANCINISGIPFMGQSLKLSRPTKYAGPSLPYYEWDDLLSRWMTGELKMQTSGHPSPVIRLTNMVSTEELRCDDSYKDIVDECREECSQYGNVVRIVVPRPGEVASLAAVGKVFVEMGSIEEAKAVLVALKGRTFDGRVVDVKFFPLDKLLKSDFSDPPPVIITARGVTTVDAVVGNTSTQLTAAQMSVGGALEAAMASASAHALGNGSSVADLRSLVHK